jgi:DNA-binding CsgD family transcriptional regulator
MKRRSIRLTQLAYRLDIPDSEWYGTVAEEAAGLTPEGIGAMVYAFDVSAAGAGVRIPDWASYGVPEEFTRATLELNRRTTTAEAALFYRRGILCGTVSEQLATAGQSSRDGSTYDDTVAGLGIPDSFGVTASAPDGRGIVVNAPLSRRTRLDSRTRHVWRQLGVHLQAAHRLRRSLQQGDDRRQAIIDPSGRIEDARSDARQPDARERLARAARNIDRARSSHAPDDACEALELWEGLVDGRWSLVEHVESDGRRYFVAHANAYGLEDPRALTPRERHVVAHIGQGDSNKWTAYQLGVREGTVARLLERALHKLGLSSRHELVWIYSTLHRT